MTSKIRLDMRLSRLIDAFPQARSVFAAHGLGTLVDEENLPVIGPFLTLETALLGHGISPANFLKLLEDCRQEEPVLDAPSHLNAEDTDPTHLLALMTCGLKVPFARALASFINDLQHQHGEQVNYSVVSNLNHEHSYYPYVNHVKTVADLPDPCGNVTSPYAAMRTSSAMPCCCPFTKNTAVQASQRWPATFMTAGIRLRWSKPPAASGRRHFT